MTWDEFRAEMKRGRQRWLPARKLSEQIIITPIPPGVDEEFRNRLAEAIVASFWDRGRTRESDNETDVTINYNLIANDIITFFIGRGWTAP